MGVVDLALDPGGNEVALKRLALHGTAAEMTRARVRLRREAEVLQSLDHPGIVPLLRVLDDGDDVVLVLPYLAGGSLAERVSRRGPLPFAEVEALADHLLTALAVAHRQGVVHRDITPSNVLFDAASRPFLADFGVARPPDATPGLTAVGLVVGTAGFMAPEQARGRPATPASDLFSLGATLVYAATGRSVYGRGEPEVLHYRAVRGQVARLSRSMPAALRRRLDPLLEVRPSRRPSAVAALGQGPDGTALRTARARRRRSSGPRRGRFLLGRTARHRLWAGQRTGLPVGQRFGLRVGLRVGLALALLATFAGWAASRLTADQGDDAAPGAAPVPDAPVCAEGSADYDGDPANGCEAVGDGLDGRALRGRLAANLVPALDVDRYTVEVEDRPHLTCNGTLTLTLTAPLGLTQRLEVFADGALVGSTTSADGEPRQVELREPACGSDDATTLDLVVSSVGSDRSADPYLLERAGSF